VSWDRVQQLEAELKHDMLAFLTALNENLDPEDARHVHYGMTSSDVLDTALAIQCRQALQMIREELVTCARVFRDKAEKFQKLVGVGRSHGIHGEPVSFGLKFLLWYGDFGRLVQWVDQAIETISVGKCSGAMGTLIHLPVEVEEDFCQALGLKPETVATQVVQRDRHAYVHSVLALIGSGIEKISVELRHWQRTEVAEAEEGFTKGQKGSSAMPHKKNPISAENLTGCARMLRSYVVAALEDVALWHERDISHSSVERVFTPDAFILCDYALSRLHTLVSNLVVHDNRVTQNLELSRGLPFSQTVLLTLTEHGLSREQAYAIVQEHCFAVGSSPSEHLRSRLLADKRVTEKVPERKIKDAFDPKRFLVSTAAIFKRTIHQVEPLLQGERA
jgi:adenylosuccinate lyase